LTLRQALLGLLAARAMTGYELTRTFASRLAHVWMAQHARIYPELVRMERDGLVRVIERGPRGSKRYQITDSGRDLVREWLVATPPNRDSRNESLLRIFFLWLLTPEEAQAYLEKETVAHRLVLAEYLAMQASPHQPPDPEAPYAAVLLEWGVRYESAMLEWLAWAIDRVGQGPEMEPLTAAANR
jgi:DNA-binding PadR family transcriptional regulator